tara:strand:+ start:258 stop:581 length:324 start_codon:yes stop_codon:yes gene_type:complete
MIRNSDYWNSPFKLVQNKFKRFLLIFWLLKKFQARQVVRVVFSYSQYSPLCKETPDVSRRIAEGSCLLFSSLTVLTLSPGYIDEESPIAGVQLRQFLHEVAVPFGTK